MIPSADELRRKSKAVYREMAHRERERFWQSVRQWLGFGGGAKR